MTILKMTVKYLANLKPLIECSMSERSYFIVLNLVKVFVHLGYIENRLITFNHIFKFHDFCFTLVQKSVTIADLNPDGDNAPWVSSNFPNIDASPSFLLIKRDVSSTTLG